jgi:hypothetical protein
MIWPLLFPLYEFLARPIRILKFEIFQRIFGGFMGFLCSSDSKIVELHRAHEKLIVWEKKQSSDFSRVI